MTTEERIQKIAPDREIVPPGEVLGIIEPVDPDNLVHLGNGIYEARWINAEEGRAEIIELAKQMGSVRILSEAPYAPASLPAGIAVQLAVTLLPMQRSTEVN